MIEEEILHFLYLISIKKKDVSVDNGVYTSRAVC